MQCQPARNGWPNVHPFSQAVRSAPLLIPSSLLRMPGEVPLSPNLLLERAIRVDRPRQVIVGDITYLPLQNADWAYLATWMDLFSRKIVGWQVADSMTAELVIEALKKAIL